MCVCLCVWGGMEYGNFALIFEKDSHMCAPPLAAQPRGDCRTIATGKDGLPPPLKADGCEGRWDAGEWGKLFKEAKARYAVR